MELVKPVYIMQDKDKKSLTINSKPSELDLKNNNIINDDIDKAVNEFILYETFNNKKALDFSVS
jgi:hypothetical protein